MHSPLFYSLALLAGAVTLSLGQDFTGLPECAADAIYSALAATTCAVTDIVCLCTDPTLHNTLMDAVLTSCTPAEQAQAQAYANKLCPTSSSAAASTTTSTTSTESSTTTVPTAEITSPSTIATTGSTATTFAIATGSPAFTSTTAVATTTTTSKSSAALTTTASSGTTALKSTVTQYEGAATTFPEVGTVRLWSVAFAMVGMGWIFAEL